MAKIISFPALPKAGKIADRTEDLVASELRLAELVHEIQSHLAILRAVLVDFQRPTDPTQAGPHKGTTYEGKILP